ncbi:twin-arginine translocation signal domain-containing protein [Arcobacter sp. FWKO B]|uniref:twin-arginine translocation signal domain-containing protein n=1 Tax=Arcobacter sp. FWKO B TaxID=2593672 RepID=UPI0018A64C25|nr:twin-arginine translocation signal domain-containing protein [Arcobacter sp. FWKO B]QOG11810.1 twin-arginine translocation signal domain-containing protein [Arcobacter sp. FWKO B]
MQNSRRDFVKKAAIVTGTAALGATVLTATTVKGSASQVSNGVVVGKSKKQEILYKKTAAWEEYYKQAK